MGLILAPIAADKVGVWSAFLEECRTTRKAAFDEFNRRHQLTRHEAWLCETPGGPMIIAIHEGPGADTLIPSLAQSTDEMDQWFAGKLSEIHGMDLSKPPPGKAPELKLRWTA